MISLNGSSLYYVSTLIGNSVCSSVDGYGTAASVSNLLGITPIVNGSYIVGSIGDGKIRRINSSNYVSTVALLPSIFGVAVSINGNYLAVGVNERKIYSVDGTGAYSVLAGSGVAGSQDGQGQSAQFNIAPGIAVAVDGTIYIGDYGNNNIRAISTSGYVSTVAGLGTGYKDGQGLSAQFNGPRQIVLNGSDLFIADYDNHRIRKIDATGLVSTYGK